MAIEILTGFVLAVFCSVFFRSSGNQIWTWLLAQAGEGARRWTARAAVPLVAVTWTVWSAYKVRPSTGQERDGSAAPG